MTVDSLAVLDVLGRKADGPTLQSLRQVWDAYAAERSSGCSPFAAAVRVATRADRLGQAFAVGYPAALEHLLPDVELPGALCATESGGNHPRAIETRLEPHGQGFRLDGMKTFVTFGAFAKTLIIVARAGEKPDGRPNLVVVGVPANRAGVDVQELPPTSFVPEIPHASVSLEGVVVDATERLPGDGYLRYLKPFRTVEDIHVIGAAIAYLVGLARRADGASGLIADLAAGLVALDRLRIEPPLDPRVHVALQGVYSRVTQADDTGELDSLLRSAPSEEGARWARDRVLLRVASKARETRFERARAALLS
jgi:alkylation response protein AidB-like acyl-CoA dehydrogenase